MNLNITIKLIISVIVETATKRLFLTNCNLLALALSFAALCSFVVVSYSVFN